ncbi:MAG: acetolactate decarboxylase [Candidatus Bathyarchaeota archaeon]|nr:acetolactate decarboxylase [Candidatus Bathyarchaeota archaeon]
MSDKRVWFSVIAVVLVTSLVLGVLYEFGQLRFGLYAKADEPTLFQIAPFNTFSEGNYDGNTTFKELAEHGDFGIGTLVGLNGEMIALDGVFYHVPSDGNPRQIAPSEKVPYATVTFFDTDETVEVADLNYSQLMTKLDSVFPSDEAIYAIKVHGNFEYALTRSPQLQTKPYPNLTEALSTQSFFTLNNVDATAVGFWFPNSMSGVDYAGYHLHLITDDFNAGGHLLECTINNATVEIEQINTYQLVIP